MKTNKILKSITSVLMLVLLIFTSCTEDNFEQDDNSLEAQEQALEITPVVQKLLDMGYAIETIVKTDNFYIVEGDLAFSKDINDYTSPQNGNSRHYYIGVTVSDENISSLKVYSDISEPFNQIPQIGESFWRDAIDDAIDDWNTVTNQSCIHFELTTIEAQADIKITGINQSNFEGLGVTPGYPSLPPVGEPYPEFHINFAYNDGAEVSAMLKRNIIGHELGHCIGFRHTDVDDGGVVVSGTEFSSDPDSIMSAGEGILERTIIGFTDQDKIAVNELYGNCGNIINPTITLSGPSTICNNSNAVSYSLPSGEIADDWSVTQELQILSETSTNVTVKPINNGLSSQATINALDGFGNTIATKTITIDGGPTPNTPPSITGPSTLKSYQTGSFYTSNTNFNNYTNVEWVVFSYVFPNAGQHFEIQNANNNDFHAFLEVLPSAPAGNYTIQCRVSNNCGTYYIDKTFNVKKGKPQIFNF